MANQHTGERGLNRKTLVDIAFIDLADIVKKHPENDKVKVSVRVTPPDRFGQPHHGGRMLDQPAAPGMMHRHSSSSPLKANSYFCKNSLRKRSEKRIFHRDDRGLQFSFPLIQLIAPLSGAV